MTGIVDKSMMMNGPMAGDGPAIAAGPATAAGNRDVRDIRGARDGRSRSHGLWASALRSLRYDCARVELRSWRTVALALAIPAASALVALALWLLGIDAAVWSGMMGGMTSMVIMLGVFGMASFAAMEDVGGHRAMAGLVPLRRDAQVLGRFLCLLVAAASAAVDMLAVCGVFALFGGPVSGGMFELSREVLWLVPMAAAAVAACGAVLLALSFRFTYQKTMMVLFFLIIGSFWGLELVRRLVDGFAPGVGEAMLGFLSVPWHALLVAVAVLAAVIAVCVALSMRFCRRRDL